MQTEGRLYTDAGSVICLLATLCKAVRKRTADRREGSKEKRTPGVPYRRDPVEALAQSQVLFFEGHEVIRCDGSREDLCPRGSSGVRGRVGWVVAMTRGVVGCGRD